MITVQAWAHLLQETWRKRRRLAPRHLQNQNQIILRRPSRLITLLSLLVCLLCNNVTVRSSLIRRKRSIPRNKTSSLDYFCNYYLPHYFCLIYWFLFCFLSPRKYSLLSTRINILFFAKETNKQTPMSTKKWKSLYRKSQLCAWFLENHLNVITWLFCDSMWQ